MRPTTPGPGTTLCYVCHTNLVQAKGLGEMVCPNNACVKYVPLEPTT